MIKYAEHTKAVEMNGEWIVLDAENYLVTKLNEMGGWLYNLLREGLGEDELVKAVTDAYDITADQAQQDVSLFIEQLVSHGLITNEQ